MKLTYVQHGDLFLTIVVEQKVGNGQCAYTGILTSEELQRFQQGDRSLKYLKIRALRHHLRAYIKSVTGV
jgi:hypothetical protein